MANTTRLISVDTEPFAATCSFIVSGLGSVSKLIPDSLSCPNSTARAAELINQYKQVLVIAQVRYAGAVRQKAFWDTHTLFRLSAILRISDSLKSAAVGDFTSLALSQRP